jgi:iron(III) transport system ATP-binding protein
MNTAEFINGTAKSHEWGPRGTAGATFAGRLTFEDVSLSFGPIQAVRGVSFDLEPGEIVCLLGPSGCGKTTLCASRQGSNVHSRDEC